MATVVLRVDGPNLDLEQCRTWLPEASVQNIWRVGDKLRGKGDASSATSGFTLLLAEADDNAVAIVDAQNALARHADQIAGLVAGGTSVEFDIGVMVAASGSQSVRLGRELLAGIYRSGVELVVTAYPCSD